MPDYPYMNNSEYDFDLYGALWEEYLEWCAGGYVIRDRKTRKPIAVGTRPSLSDFEVWKQSQGYYLDQIEDE